MSPNVKNDFLNGNFSFFSDPSLGKCHRCMVIIEKHSNVLQYKESKCDLIRTERHYICGRTADAHLILPP